MGLWFQLRHQGILFSYFNRGNCTTTYTYSNIPPGAGRDRSEEETAHFPQSITTHGSGASSSHKPTAAASRPP